jgi:5'-nucleotidase
VRFLLTNDDGVGHPGLWAMREALARAGLDLLVVAPSRDRSACGRGFSKKRLSVRRTRGSEASDIFAVDGTPVDCVRVAYSGARPGFLPDVVVSGINDGANLGENIAYSGTVAGAAEGAMFGAVGIAVAVDGENSSGESRVTLDEAAGIAWSVVRRLCHRPEFRGVVVNVNVPATRPLGVEIAKLAQIALVDGLFGGVRPADGAFLSYRDGAVFVDEPGTDAAVLASGCVAISAIRPTRIPSCNNLLNDVGGLEASSAEILESSSSSGRGDSELP